MNFTLKRNVRALYGVTGDFISEDGLHRFVSLEHAYSEGPMFFPKLAPGVYTCVAHPPHRLRYKTFMVIGVPKFQGCKVDGILIHIGNYNGDSEGCILLGMSLGTGCILDSRIAFEQFMALQEGLQSFTLTVI